MRHLDLFSGIGGFAYAAQQVWGDGYENVGFCEIDHFCQQVLRKNFPGCAIHADIRTLTNANGAGSQGQNGTGASGNAGPGEYVDLITGGFPCQPFSQAGKRRGTADDRHLWPEMLRVIQEFQPAWVIGENVGGFVTWNNGMVFEQVCSDLEAAGYEVQPFIIPAVSVNAPHRRDRVWIVAHAVNSRSGRTQRGSAPAQDSLSSKHRKKDCAARQSVRAGRHWKVNKPTADAAYRIVRGLGLERQPDQETTKPCGRGGNASNASSVRRQSRSIIDRPQSPQVRSKRKCKAKRFDVPEWERDWREVATTTCTSRMDDGVSGRLVRLPDGNAISKARWRREAIKAYGNAIVPQVAIEIMRAIKDATKV